MEPVRNFNIPVSYLREMDDETRTEFDSYVDSIGCTYTVTE